MIIVSRPRRMGKTTEAVKWVKEGRIDGEKDTSNRILVVLGEREKNQIMKIFDLGYHEVETWNTITAGYYIPTLRTKQLFIDNADIVLQTLVQTSIKGLTVTKEEL